MDLVCPAFKLLFALNNQEIGVHSTHCRPATRLESLISANQFPPVILILTDESLPLPQRMRGRVPSLIAGSRQDAFRRAIYTIITHYKLPETQHITLCQHILHPTPSPAFTTSLIILYTFAAAITTANLYYTYPILNLTTTSSGISYQHASLIPQLLQIRYSLGILLLYPLGDILRLRYLLFTLILIMTLTWFPLCPTPSFHAFDALSFLTSLITVGGLGAGVGIWLYGSLFD